MLDYHFGGFIAIQLIFINEYMFDKPFTKKLYYINSIKKLFYMNCICLDNYTLKMNMYRKKLYIYTYWHITLLDLLGTQIKGT